MSNPIAAAIAERRARIAELTEEISKLEQVEHLLGGEPMKPPPRTRKERAVPVEKMPKTVRASRAPLSKASDSAFGCGHPRSKENSYPATYVKADGTRSTVCRTCTLARQKRSREPVAKSEPDPARWVSPPATEGIPSLRDEASRAFGFGAGGSSSLLKNAILRRELEQEEAIVATAPGQIEVCRFCGTGVSGGAEACARCHRKNFGKKSKGLPGAVRVSTSKEIAFVGPDPINRSLYRGQGRRPGVCPPPESSGGQLEP